MQRIFKYGGIQTIILTPDKKCWTFWYTERLLISLYEKLYTFKNGPIFWPTLYLSDSSSLRAYSYCYRSRV